MNQKNLKIILCVPRGFCAGVTRAIKTVEKAIEKYPSPVYVRHEIVHNKYVVEELKKKGAVFIEEIDAIPDQSVVIFSAHGVPENIKKWAERKRLTTIDATCPLVERAHLKAKSNYAKGVTTVLIGHKGHPEVIGTMGQVPAEAIILISSTDDIEKLNPGLRISYVTQTTLSVDETRDIINALKQKFPYLENSGDDNDICYATTNRQRAVKEIAGVCDMMLVVGSPNSSNSRRLAEVARKNGCPDTFLIQNDDDIDWNKLKDIDTLGITAGASAPEILIDNILKRAKNYFDITVENGSGKKEDLNFKLPKGLE